MKPADLLKQAEILVMYMRTLPHIVMPLVVKDALVAIDDFGDEVYNHLYDESRSDTQ